MTAQEAIKAIKDNKPTSGYYILCEALDMATEALEKQIPKKPLDIITSDNEFICMICPSCQKIAVEFNDKYCRCCGQALDWSEEE